MTNLFLLNEKITNSLNYNFFYLITSVTCGFIVSVLFLLGYILFFIIPSYHSNRFGYRRRAVTINNNCRNVVLNLSVNSRGLYVINDTLFTLNRCLLNNIIYTSNTVFFYNSMDNSIIFGKQINTNNISISISRFKLRRTRASVEVVCPTGYTCSSTVTAGSIIYTFTYIE